VPTAVRARQAGQGSRPAAPDRPGDSHVGDAHLDDETRGQEPGQIWRQRDREKRDRHRSNACDDEAAPLARIASGTSRSISHPYPTSGQGRNQPHCMQARRERARDLRQDALVCNRGSRRVAPDATASVQMRRRDVRSGACDTPSTIMQRCGPRLRGSTHSVGSGRGRQQFNDLLLVTVGGETFATLLPRVKRGGKIVAFSESRPAPRNGACGSRHPDACRSRRRLTAACAGIVAGELVIPIGERLPLSNAREAHRLAERGGTGKVLLTV